MSLDRLDRILESHPRGLRPARDLRALSARRHTASRRARKSSHGTTPSIFIKRLVLGVKTGRYQVQAKIEKTLWPNTGPVPKSEATLLLPYQYTETPWPPSRTPLWTAS